MPNHATSSRYLVRAATSTTEDGSGASYNLEAFIEALLLVNVSALDTGSVTLTIETSHDNETWYTHTTLTAITAAGRTAHSLTNFGRHVRVSWELSGGATATFSLEFIGKT